jgi:hypothetical protein
VESRTCIRPEMTKLFPEVRCQIIEALNCDIGVYAEFSEAVPVSKGEQKAKDSCIVRFWQ